MKIAYIVKGNPYDKHSWSGTNYYVRDSLEKQGHKVYCLYDFKPKMPLRIITRKIVAKIFGKKYSFDRSDSYSKQWADYITSNLQKDTDAIFSLGTMMIANLKTNIPIYVYIDGIFEQMRSFYNWDNLTKKCIDDGNTLEQKALDNCKKVISCSIETGKAIRKYYRIDDSKISIVPLGANIDSSPSEEEVIRNIESKDYDVCKILFVGVDYFRKGADIVYKTAGILSERGMKLEAHFCGLRDFPIKDLPDYVIDHGFLNKGTKSGYSELISLYKSCHFLFVPSRAEAYGLVFCEACAYGLPSVSHRLGGLTTIIEDGVNGKLFDLGTEPIEFANYIESIFNDRVKYKELAKNAILSYKKNLNWNVAGKRLTDIMMNASK